MKQTKRFMAGALSLVLAAGLLAGCSSPSEPEPSSAPAPTDAVSTELPTEAKELTMELLDSEAMTAIQDKLDSQWAYDLIYECSQVGNDGNDLGFRNAGSTGEAKARKIIEDAMEEIGLQDIESLPFDVDAWEFTSAKLTTSDSEEITLSAFAGSVGTDGPITTQLVDVGNGTLGSYEGVDVTGKIVLAEFDNMLGYWFSAPQYEAELHGAAAIICATNSELNNATDEGMLCFDGCLRTTIPCLSISRKDAQALRDRLASGDSTVTLDAQMTVEPGTSYNVVGYIPGKDPEHIISMGAHYDGWYHSFQDDLYGVGMELAIAKAMIESGYQPEYTIAFIAFGSEEYGVADTVFDDWCIGSWSMVTKHHPEWVGKSLAHLEIDSVRPDADTYTINATVEMETFIQAYVDTLTTEDLPEQMRENGIAMAGWAGPWSQDYDFTRKGIPGLTARQSLTPWKAESYHTQFDDSTAWNEELFSFHAREYVKWLYTLQHAAIVPLDLSNIADRITEGMDTAAVAGTDIESAYKNAVENLGAVADEYYASLQMVNHLYTLILSADNADAAAIDELKAALSDEMSRLLEAYKLIEDDFMGLDQWQTMAFRDQYTANNYNNLTATLEALKSGDGAAALDALIGVDTTYLAADFSREVYEYVGITGINGSKNWAEGKAVTMLNTYDAYNAIAGKVASGSTDFTDEIAMVEALLAQETEIIEDVLTSGAGILEQAAECMKVENLQTIINIEKEILS